MPRSGPSGPEETLATWLSGSLRLMEVEVSKNTAPREPLGEFSERIMNGAEVEFSRYRGADSRVRLGQKGRQYSRNLIAAFTRSRESTRRGSAQIDLPPRALGPPSSRP